MNKEKKTAKNFLNMASEQNNNTTTNSIKVDLDTGALQQPRFKVIHNRTGRQHAEAGSLTEITDLLYEPTADQFTIHDTKAGDFCNAAVIFNSKPQKK